MAHRVMFVQLKTGYDIDAGPAWISIVAFSKTWTTAYWNDRTLRRAPRLIDANFYDVATDEEFWISGPHRDQRDVRYSSIRPTVDDEVRGLYDAFLRSGDWPERLSRRTIRARAAAPPSLPERADRS